MNLKGSALALPVRTSSYTYLLLPNLECLSPQNAIVARLHQVAAKTEEIVSEPVEGQKLLSLSRRLKPSHMILTLPYRLIRHFGSVIRIGMIAVFQHRHRSFEVCRSSAIAVHPLGL